MVTITGVKEVETQNGKTFTSIELQGEPQILQSETTGNYYLTANNTRVTTMIPIEACKMLIGKQLPGTIEKTEVEPYQHINKETGEVRTLDYTYVYCPEKQSVQTMQSMQSMQSGFEMPFMQTQAMPLNTDISGLITH